MKSFSVFLLVLIQLGGVLLQDLGDLDSDDMDDDGEELEEKPLGDCPALTVPPVVFTTSNAKSVGSVVKMTCRPGYKHVGGDRTRACQATLTWSGKDIVCKPIECFELNVKNTVANSTKRTFGSSIKFSCKKGTFKEAGDEVRTCLANRMWSGATLICQPPKCKELPPVPHSRTNSTERVVGTVRKYSCNRGWEKRKGYNIRRCNKNSKWTGRPLVCSRPQCKKPPTIPHTTKSSKERKIGTVLTYKCKKGYKGTGSARIVCMRSRSWSTMLDLKCRAAGKRRKGKSAAGKRRKGKSGKCPQLKVKPHVRKIKRRWGFLLKCRNHYTRKGRGNGRVKARCQGGRWSGGEDFECQLVCPNPGQKWIVFNYTNGSKKKAIQGTRGNFSCGIGFVQVGGESQRVCRNDGFWSGDDLKCRGDDNLASGKHAFQSSSFHNHSIVGSAGRALIINSHLTVVRKGCALTAGTEEPWWAVDLQEQYPIDHVIIRNNGVGGKAKNLQGAIISVTNRKPVKGAYKPQPKESCSNIDLKWYYRYKVYKCKSTLVGRYVVIHKKTKSQLLLCVVLVVPKKSLTRLQPAFQSSTYMNYTASLAVDVRRSSEPEHCSSTKSQVDPWWAVDLSAPKAVETVYLFYKTMTNPADKLANFSVSVTNVRPSGDNYSPAAKDICYSQSEPMKSGEIKRVTCKPGLSGRYLVVSMKGRGSLSLCEIMAYEKIKA